MNLVLITVIVGFAAGVVRGYAGFGGPAFILSVMTWFLTPVQVIAKVLIVELVAAAFLAWRCRKDIQWKLVLALTLPTVASLPFGHWLLMHNDADLMGKVISAAIVLSSLLMLAKVKYPRKYTTVQLVLIGAFGGLVFGASYIAMLLVAIILMAPYKHYEVRTLFVIWGFLIAGWYLAVSVITGNTVATDFLDALPLGLAYLAGCLVGAELFKKATDANYRRNALLVLITLGIIGLLR